MLLAAKRCRKVKTEAAVPALGARGAQFLGLCAVLSHGCCCWWSREDCGNILQCQAQTWPSIFSLIHTEMSWPEGAGGCHQLVFFVSQGAERTATCLTGRPVLQSR